MFKPCKTDATFEMVPQGKINRKLLIERICREFNGKISADQSFITIINTAEAKISVSKDNRILIKGIEDEEKARKIANRIMGVLMK
jgi:hypothetical protein